MRQPPFIPPQNRPTLPASPPPDPALGLPPVLTGSALLSAPSCAASSAASYPHCPPQPLQQQQEQEAEDPYKVSTTHSHRQAGRQEARE